MGPPSRGRSRKCQGSGTGMAGGMVGESANSCVIFVKKPEVGADEAGQVGKAWWGTAWCHLTWDREPLGQKPRTILLDLHLTSIVPAAVWRDDLEKNCTGRRNSNWEVSWKLTREHWGLKSGNRKGGDRLDMSSILGRGRVA